jgi:hypothetical protein
MEIPMILRPLTAALVLAAGIAGATGARAEIQVGGSYFPNTDEQAILEACRGLEAQSRMSLTSDVPDDIESADSASEWALDRLPFTLRDCREAGIV